VLGHTNFNIHTNQRINQLNFLKDGDVVADGNAICKLDVDHVPCFVAVVTCRFVHEASDLSTSRISVDKYQLEQTRMTKLALYDMPVVLESTFVPYGPFLGGSIGFQPESDGMHYNLGTNNRTKASSSGPGSFFGVLKERHPQSPPPIYYLSCVASLPSHILLLLIVVSSHGFFIL
jgi:hypothetical protein